MKPLCSLRDIFRSIRDFEEAFQQKHELCLNEGMMLCSLKDEVLKSTELAERLGLTPSNMSKVIKSVESKGLVERILGKEDKRQMYFSLTPEGRKKLTIIKKEETKIIELLEIIAQLAGISDNHQK